MFVCFKGDKGDFITVDTYDATWTTQKKGSSVTCKKMTLKSGVTVWLVYLLLWEQVD